MSLKPRDPLLAFTRFVLGILMAAFVFASAVIGIALPAVAIFRGKIVGELAVNGAPPEAIWAIVMLLLLIGAAAGLGFLFFRHLYRIVGSVGEGDPFIPVNATRLHNMAWIVVAMNVLGVLVVPVARWLEQVTEQIHTGIDLSFDSLLLAIILFILARVFRKGTEMRAELEGTV